jgi:hypothetical protein
LVSRERQRAHLNETVQRCAAHGAPPEMGARRSWRSSFRLATRALGKLLGRVDVEDILDVIFRDFCIATASIAARRMFHVKQKAARCDFARAGNGRVTRSPVEAQPRRIRPCALDTT